MSSSTTLKAKFSKTQIPEVYAGKASSYDIWGKLTESKAQKRCLELADIRDGETILEVAVGTGLTFTQILQQNPSGWNEGLDLTEPMLAKARAKAIRSGTNNYHLRIGDAYNLPFGPDEFDLLVNNYMFDLLPEEDFPHILTEFKRVLRPGGRLVLVNMGQGGHWYNGIWDRLYRLSSTSMGGCRTVSLVEPMQAVGFELTNREFISQMTFPSEIITGIKIT